MADSYAAAVRVIGNANWCGSRAAAGRPVGCSYGIVVDRCCCRIRGATFAGPDRPSRASAVDGGGHAVDFYDGHLLTGADGESIYLLSLLDAVVSAGADVGRSEGGLMGSQQ
jgi:hypothetical protein